MNYELQDIRVVKIFPIISTPTGFSKREFVIATDEEYPQLIKFELRNRKCALISGIFPGDTINISFNIRGKEWIDEINNKVVYFTSFVVWKIQKMENGYKVPSKINNEDSPHLQHTFNFPPASEVFERLTNKLDKIENRLNNEDYSDLPF